MLDEKRRKLIVQAIGLYGVEDTLKAVQGWQFSPLHRGENERRTIYNDLELLLRDVRHIEMFIGWFERGEPAEPLARMDRYVVDALQGNLPPLMP